MPWRWTCLKAAASPVTRPRRSSRPRSQSSSRRTEDQLSSMGRKRGRPRLAEAGRVPDQVRRLRRRQCQLAERLEGDAHRRYVSWALLELDLAAHSLGAGHIRVACLCEAQNAEGWSHDPAQRAGQPEHLNTHARLAARLEQAGQLPAHDGPRADLAEQDSLVEYQPERDRVFGTDYVLTSHADADQPVDVLGRQPGTPGDDQRPGVLRRPDQAGHG